MISLSYIYSFLLVLTRLTSFFVTVPIFSAKGVPNQFKLGLGFFISVVIFPTIGLTSQVITLNSQFVFLIIQEIVIGLMLGWIAQLLLTSIHVAGAFIDMQIGFAIANVIDPQTGMQSPLMGNFKYMFAILLFLIIDGHHLLIDGIVSSYQLLPMNGDWLSNLNNESMITFVMGVFLNMFVLAFKIAAPFVGTLFLTDVTLGIVARTVPQLNVFVVGMPLKVLVHFILMFIVVPTIIIMFKEVFQEMIRSIQQMIGIMGL